MRRRYVPGMFAAAVGPGEEAGNFAWLEKIENGILVHFNMAVKQRSRISAQMLAGMDIEPYQAGDKVVEHHFVSSKTVFCKDLSEVHKAIERAVQAHEEIQKLEKDGKFGGAQIAESV